MYVRWAVDGVVVADVPPRTMMRVLKRAMNFERAGAKMRLARCTLVTRSSRAQVGVWVLFSELIFDLVVCWPFRIHLVR